MRLLFGTMPVDLIRGVNEGEGLTGKAKEAFDLFMLVKENCRADYFIYSLPVPLDMKRMSAMELALGVPFQRINMGLLSAQERICLYAHNIPDVPAPQDRDILFQNVLCEPCGGTLFCVVRQKVTFGKTGQGKGVHSGYCYTPNNRGKAPSLDTDVLACWQVSADSPYTFKVKDFEVWAEADGCSFAYKVSLPNGCYAVRELSLQEVAGLQGTPSNCLVPAMQSISKADLRSQLVKAQPVQPLGYLLSHISGLDEQSVEVFSLFDGISCPQMALLERGISPSCYYASELSTVAGGFTQLVFPNTKQVGNESQQSFWHAVIAGAYSF